MNKAFIFDMDGVIVDSENVWMRYEKSFLNEIFGEEIAEKIGDTIGSTIYEIYDTAAKYGFSMDKEQYTKLYDQQAAFIYSKADITLGIEKLAEYLTSQRFKLGVVSSSRTAWINQVIPRLDFRDQFNCIISINDNPHLRQKPHPDGYLEAMQLLESRPETTIILEDSNRGIQAAKASGAFTIALKQNLVPGYVQTGADAYANTVFEVLTLIKNLAKSVTVK